MQRKLTKSVVEKAPLPDETEAILWDSDLSGFGVRISPKGVRTYFVQARVNRRTRRVRLGRHGVLTAEEARRKAREALGKMAAGIDPTAERRRQDALTVTLSEVVADYLKNRRRKDGTPLADRTKRDVSEHLKRNFHGWADRPIADITRESVRRRYAEIGRRSHAQANQAMRVLSALINYARAVYRGPGGENVIPDNPVEVIHDSRTYMGDVRPRERRVPMERAGEFYAALEATRTDPSVGLGARTKAAAALVLMLTGLRRSDVTRRTWGDVDLDAGALFVEDTKHRQPRTFPLPRQAVAILRDMRELSSGRYVFGTISGTSPVHNLSDGMRPACNAMGLHVSAHDLRRTYIDVADHVGIDPLVAELLSNRKGAAYQAMATRLKHYASSDLTRYREHAQKVADWFEQARLAYQADNVVSIRVTA